MFNKIRKNKKGFTLAELLIVVAIVAVLTAIAIPVFKAQLDKATAATHEANARSFHAEAMMEYLSKDETGGKKPPYEGTLGSDKNQMTYTWEIDPDKSTQALVKEKNNCTNAGSACPHKWNFIMESGITGTP